MAWQAMAWQRRAGLGPRGTQGPGTQGHRAPPPMPKSFKSHLKVIFDPFGSHRLILKSFESHFKVILATLHGRRVTLRVGTGVNRNRCGTGTGLNRNRCEPESFMAKSNRLEPRQPCFLSGFGFLLLPAAESEGVYHQGTTKADESYSNTNSGP